ncbi:MAG: transcriptional repressor [Treponema sp.]|jgi:Fur family ferric uptake transcriptional regulator|nr:transcriptional repressor [Treponema sp.]
MTRKRPANYHTRQGEDILDYIRSLGGRHVTISSMARYFADRDETIGQTTIYRHLERLAAEGSIHKYVLGDGKSACYQYVDNKAVCREHFHLICDRCGALIHVDCDLLEELRAHLLLEHKFQIDLLKTVLYGTCDTCLSAAPSPEAAL